MGAIEGKGKGSFPSKSVAFGGAVISVALVCGAIFVKEKLGFFLPHLRTGGEILD